MSWIRRAASLYRRWRNQGQAEQELDDEVQAYFAILVDRNMARGLTREQAIRSARIEFEGPEQVKHRVRDARTGAGLETTLRDIRYAARVLRKAPGFTAVAVLTLALGIGANTAIFSLADALFLKPLKIHNPKEIVGCYSVDIHRPDQSRAFSYPNYADLRDKNAVFSNLAAHSPGEAGLTEGERTRRVQADFVSSNYFDTMGAALFQGRAFTAAEEKPDAGIPAAIVSYSYWQKHGSDPEQLGRRCESTEGISPWLESRLRDSREPSPCSQRTHPPLGTYSFVTGAFGARGHSLSERDNPQLILIGRLKPGLTERAVNARLAGAGFADGEGIPGGEQGPNVCRSSAVEAERLAEPGNGRVEIGAAGLSVDDVHACGGSADCFAQSCQHDAGPRIGAAEGDCDPARDWGRRGRIVRQLCTEGFLHAILGGAAGLVVASCGSMLLFRSWASVLPFDVVFSTAPNMRVLAATMAFWML